MKVVRGTPKHLSKTGKLNNFTYLMLNLEFNCNYNCQKCFSQEIADREYAKDTLITLKDRIGLIREAKKLGGKAVVIAGEGEPALHKDFQKLIEEINSSGMVPIIYTNGSLIGEKISKFLRQNNTTIIISLDSLETEKYDLMTGTKNCLEKVLKNIETIRKEYKGTVVKQGAMKILSFAINTTVSKINHGQVAKIKKLCGKDVYFICNPLAKLGKASKTWGALMEQNRSEDYSGLIKNMSESGGPLMLGKNGTCNYSSNGIAISPEGYYSIGL